ncbi:hypothetical protein [Pseudoalteromonas phenolica]|uniref:Uncharacterized protein n=1 Tax=Pseudoalteromonas phenolica TaxID=161398 RepID=A0A0S2K7U8_9GAMM|nr:hypothetical protein [Pseudoalteromonas phenolica]ALO44115.1 hypothetical protein PP2015_3641 [Pseudoalteromonas phenolica]
MSSINFVHTDNLIAQIDLSDVKGKKLRMKDTKMKKLLLTALIAASTFAFSATTDARGSSIEDFRYYHFQCLDSNSKQLWFEISSTYDRSIGARCASDGGTMRVTKVFW